MGGAGPAAGGQAAQEAGGAREADRQLFDGLIWLARTGGQWAAIPRRCGAKSTIHDRF